LIASAVSLWEDHPASLKSEWVERAQLILEQAGEHIDYMAFHRYAHPTLDDPFETYMAFAASYNEHLTAYEGLIRAVSLERGIKHNIGIAVDEYGVMRSPADINRNVPINVVRDELGVMRQTVNTRDDRYREGGGIINLLEDALVSALYLNAFIRHAYSVRLANYGPMVVSLGKNLARIDSHVLLETVYYPFALYSRTCGQLALDVLWYGDTFSGTYRNRTYTGIRILDVTATLDKARKQLVVYVVNQSKKEAMETTISLTSGEFAGDIKASIINGPDIKAENTEEKPNQVGVRENTLKVTGKSFTFTFEPHSITALMCGIN
jgi:alpha-N-arabinofuranosidase